MIVRDKYRTVKRIDELCQNMTPGQVERVHAMIINKEELTQLHEPYA